MNEFLTAIAHFILGLMKGVLTCFGVYILAILISCLVDRLRDMVAKRKDKQAASLESTTSQVSKALCGKENATAEEIIAAFDQVKRERDELETERHQLLTRCERLEEKCRQLERERDASVADLTAIVKSCGESYCEYCEHNDKHYCAGRCWTRNEGFKWRGVKEEKQ